MKIVILSNLFSPYSRGGAEEAAKNQAIDFLNKGNEVIVITLSPLNKYFVENVAGLKVYFLPHQNIFNYFEIGKKPLILRFIWHIVDTFNLGVAEDIKHILEFESPQLVISHNLKGISLLTPRVIKKLGIVHHQVMHDVSYYTPSGLIEYGKEKIFEHTGFLTRAYRQITRKMLSHPQKIIFPSVWLLNFYTAGGFFKKQEKILEANKIDFGFQSSALPISNQQSAVSNFLYVGQLERHKGVLLLLDAFDDICKKQNAQYVQYPILHIVGGGSLLSLVKERAEKNLNIKIYGRVAREELPEFYKNARAVIVPSIVYENAPMVVSEALNFGAPVIVSRIGGAAEQIVEGKNGWTFNPGDVSDLADKIKKFL